MSHKDHIFTFLQRTQKSLFFLVHNSLHFAKEKKKRSVDDSCPSFSWVIGVSEVSSSVKVRWILGAAVLMFVYTSITRWKSDAEKQCQWFYVSRSSASGMEAIIAFSKTKKNGGCFKISSFRRECSNVDLKGHCHTAMPLKGTF